MYLLPKIHLSLTAITLFLIWMWPISLAAGRMMLMRSGFYPWGPTRFTLLTFHTSELGESFYKCVALAIQGKWQKTIVENDQSWQNLSLINPQFHWQQFASVIVYKGWSLTSTLHVFKVYFYFLQLGQFHLKQIKLYELGQKAAVTSAV